MSNHRSPEKENKLANTPDIKGGEVATFSVTVNGAAIPDTCTVRSIFVESKVNSLPSARIEVLAGDPAQADFAISSSATFVPGGKIRIYAGYDSNNSRIFEGIITGQSLKASQRFGSLLEVLCDDPAIGMTVGRKSATFANKTDSDAMTAIIGTYAGLTAKVTGTNTVFPLQVQYYASDWDLIHSRAEANGMLMTTANGTVTVAPPDADTTSVLTVTYGNDLLDMDLSLDAVGQLSSVSARSWDPAQQAVISAQESMSYQGPGNLSSKKLAQVAGPEDFQLQTTAALTSAELDTWAKARLMRSAYSKIKGHVSVMGTSLAVTGKYLTLQGAGDRFNGDHFISGVAHTMEDGNWVTKISLGLTRSSSGQQTPTMAPPASGLLPGARGLFTGTVKQVHDDPDSQYRILVDLPLFDRNGSSVWARMATFYASNGAGAFFMPEVGDEVLVAFLNEDPRYPMILGSLYSNSKHKPDSTLAPDAQNSTKALFTRSGMQVRFDDVKKTLTLSTPAHNTLVLDDDGQRVTIADQNGNKVVLSASGIDLSSTKNINISADQNVTIKGTQGVSINSAAGDVQVSGMNIKETAQSQYTAQGSMTATVQGGATLTLKGAMVMIN